MKVEESLKIIKTDKNLILEGDRYVEMKRKSTTEKEPEEVSSKLVVKQGSTDRISTSGIPPRKTSFILDGLS